MPAADSRCTVRMDCSILSHDSVTCGGSPEVSSTAFDAQPPDLPPVCLVEVGFAVLCQLAPHRRPHHPVLVHRLAPLIHASFRPRLATTPLRFSSPSPPPGWAGDFHPQAVEHVRHTEYSPGPQALGKHGMTQALKGRKKVATTTLKSIASAFATTREHPPIAGEKVCHRARRHAQQVSRKNVHVHSAHQQPHQQQIPHD